MSARNLTTPCIPGVGERTRLGYIRASVNGRRVMAHRWAFERARGPIPDGMEIDHLCRNRACCNPDHLEAVTHTTNMRRASNTKLTKEIADQIRRSVAEGARQVDVARRFGVLKQTVWLIVKGRQWA